MGGGERGRRNTGYWAPFNIWWRAHLEKHKERPKAEDLKRWYLEESRKAFPHEPPTYTMIRNHAKGLRDIASVKHYFRDYRARKRRAVADLARETSPRSEPEEEEENSSGTGSPSEEACSSDEDWQGDSKKRRQNTKERRKKRAQSDNKLPLLSASGAGAGGLHQELEPRLPQQQTFNVQQPPRRSLSAGATRLGGEPSLEDQGDLTVTVTVTHTKRDVMRCGQRLTSSLTSASSPSGSLASPLSQHQQQVQHQTPQSNVMHGSPQHKQEQYDLRVAGLLNSGNCSGGLAAEYASSGGEQAVWGDSGWRSTHKASMAPRLQLQGRDAASMPAAFPIYSALLGGGGSGDRHSSAAALQADVDQAQLLQQNQKQSYHHHEQLVHQHQHQQHLSLAHNPEPQRLGSRTSPGRYDTPLMHLAGDREPPLPVSAAATAQGTPVDIHTFTPLRRPNSGMHATAAAVAYAGAGSHGIAGEAWGPSGTPVAFNPGVALATHLSPMSSQTMPPGDAASTASTEQYRSGSVFAESLAGGIQHPEAHRGRDGASSCGGVVQSVLVPGTTEGRVVKGENVFMASHGNAEPLEPERDKVFPYSLSFCLPAAGTTAGSPVSTQVGAGNSLLHGRQMSMPSSHVCGDLRTSPLCGPRNAYEAATSPQQQHMSPATGLPPVTTGFTPSKGTIRAAAAMTIVGTLAAGSSALQSGPPCSGQLAAQVAGHVRLMGASSPPGSAVTYPFASHDRTSPGGASATICTAPAVAGPQEAGPALRSATLLSSGPHSAAAYTHTAGNTWPSEILPRPSASAAWSSVCARTLAGLPFQRPLLSASPAAAVTTAATTTAAPVPSASSGSLPPGIACGSSSARGRWVPYPTMTHLRTVPPLPWYPPPSYPYPAGPANPFSGSRSPLYPGQCMLYGRHIVRRRYVSAPSIAPLQPAVMSMPYRQQHSGYSMAQQQQQQQQEYYQQQQQQEHTQQQQQMQQSPGSLMPLPTPDTRGAVWQPSGGSPEVVHGGGHSPMYGSMGSERWACAPYDDVRVPLLVSSGSAPVLQLSSEYHPLLEGHGLADEPVVTINPGSGGRYDGPRAPGDVAAVSLPLPQGLGQGMSPACAPQAGVVAAGAPSMEDAELLESLWSSLNMADDDVGSGPMFFPAGETGGLGRSGTSAGLATSQAQPAIASSMHEFQGGMGVYGMPDGLHGTDGVIRGHFGCP